MIYEDRKKGHLEKKAQKTQGKFFLPEDIDQTILQTIDYEYPGNKIEVNLVTEEFTCICPFSGLPDYACLSIRYIPRKKLVEMKSLKYYLYAYRNVKIYNEHVVNKILIDLKRLLNPYKITVEGKFTNRGGITNTVVFSWPSSKK